MFDVRLQPETIELMNTETGSGPLQGTTIVDLTRVLSGPYCTMMLADMGARVIKVEQPGRGDDTRAWGPPFLEGESAYFLSVNRNKEGITLDFKHPTGRRLLESLIERADVLVENFRPGTLARLGLDYPSVAARFPRLVYCSISGYGHTGPRRHQPGYDAVMQAEGGLMSITGDPCGPPFRLGVAIADIVSGMFAAHGVSLALMARQNTGRGQHVDIGMLDSVAALLTYQAGIFFATGQVPTRMGNRHPTIVPYETFDARDGEFVLAVGNEEQWQRFCAVTGLNGVSTDPRFSTNSQRVLNYEHIRPIIARVLKTRDRDAWIEQLRQVGVPCGAVRDLGETLRDPQMSARGMVAQMLHTTAGRIQVLGNPMKLSETAARLRSAPPTLGQHTQHVLQNDLGLSAADIQRLRDDAVV